MRGMPVERFDVVVAGGGLAGTTAALALAAEGLEVALVDAQPPEARAPDGRASAVAFAPYRVWRALGVAERLEAVQSIAGMAVTEGEAAGAAPRVASPAWIGFDAGELAGSDAGEPLGWMVENRHAQAALAATLAHSTVRVRAPARVAAVEPDVGGCAVRLDDGTVLRAALAVAADGRDSPLRRRAGIDVVGWDYRRSAVVATVAHTEAHEGVARQVFLPAGPLAVLPLPGRRSSLVWTETPERAEALTRLPAEAFEALLLRRVGEALGPFRLESPRWNHPLRLQLAERRTAPRLALIGDAAASLHPLAGQGLNLGLKDAAALAEVLGEALRLGEDVGSAPVLDRYARRRGFDSAATALGTDALGRVYGERGAGWSALRAAGVTAAGRIGPLRRFFMREAGGATGSPPRSLQPPG